MSIWDRFGVVLSGLCIVHCILTPAIFLFFPALAAYFVPDIGLVHRILFIFILVAAGFAFWLGFGRHKQKEPLIYMGIGLFIIIMATFVVHGLVGHSWESLVAALGSLFLVRGHLLNHRYCRECKSHDHCEDSHDHT